MHTRRRAGGLMVALLLSVAGLAALTIAIVTSSPPAAAPQPVALHVSRFAATPGLAGAQGQSPETVVALALTATAAAGGPPTVPPATVTAIAGRVATAGSSIMAPFTSGTRAPGATATTTTITTTPTSAGTNTAAGVAPDPSASATVPAPATATATAPPTPTATPTPIPDVSPIYAQISPAVVIISNPAQRQPQSHSAGIASGTIYDAQGYIVTVGDIVAGTRGGPNATQLDVQLASGKTVTGKVLGLDDVTNLAVVKIDASAVPAAIALADAPTVTVGTPVIAIGAPLQFAASVTRGIISGTNRAVNGQSGLIQSSVSASSGMHGGPLVDVNGNVIGINTFNLHNDDATYRVSLAVPSDTVKRVTAALAQSGVVSRPSLGATVETLTPTRAVALSLSVNSGAYVNTVVKGGPADAAGLAPGDVITALNGTNLTEAVPLSNAMTALMPKQSVMLTVNRGGTTKQLSLTLGDTAAP